LMILLSSGLPHMDEAINAVMCSPDGEGPECLRFTPLHCALRNRQWTAALALLAAGARVDISGNVNRGSQTAATWARVSVDCKHRGVKRAIAARAKEHLAQAARCGVAGKPLSEASASHAAGASAAAPKNKPGAAIATQFGGSGLVGAGAAVKAPACSADTAIRRAKVLNQRQRSARNGCEWAASTAGEVPVVTVTTVADPDEPASAASPNRPKLLPSALPALNLLESPSAGSSSSVSAVLPVLEPSPHPVAGLNLAEDSACAGEPFGPSGATSAAGVDASSVATTVGGSAAEPASDSIVCSPAAAATFTASAERSATAQTVEYASADSTAAPLLAALHSGETSAAVARRHLTTLSELARNSAAAAALQKQGVLTAIGAALLQHGELVGRAATALMIVLRDAAAGGLNEDEAEYGAEASV